MQLLKELKPSVMHRSAAGLADHSSQPRSYDLTRLRLQCRRQNPNHWDAEVGLRQINRVQDNATRLQAFEFLLKRGNRGVSVLTTTRLRSRH